MAARIIPGDDTPEANAPASGARTPRSIERHQQEEAERAARNFLSTLRAVFHKTVENSEDLADFSAYFEGRLATLSQAYLLSLRKPYAGADLEELVREHLRFPTVSDPRQVSISGPAVRLDPLLAQSLSLAIHELAINAMKFGALSCDTGRINLKWKVAGTGGEKRLVLTWQESGVPALSPQPTRFGFGRELLEQALPYEIGAATSLEFAPGGVKCVIEAPLAKKVG